MIEETTFVRVQMRPESNCPVSSVTDGLVGVIEATRTDADGDPASLVFFGRKVPMLRNDSAWIYHENLEFIQVGEGV